MGIEVKQSAISADVSADEHESATCTALKLPTEIISHTFGGWDLVKKFPDAAMRKSIESEIDTISKLEKHTDEEAYRKRPDCCLSLALEIRGVSDALLSKVAKDFKVNNVDGYCSALEYALNESLTNHLMHGNRWDPRKTIELQINIVHDDSKNILWVELVSKDQGNGFEAAKVKDPTSDENLDHFAGRGFCLMKGFSNEIQLLDGGSKIWQKIVPSGA